MKQKHIDASREVRLWLGQIIIPALGITIAFPETREWVKNKYVEIKAKNSVRKMGL